LKVSGPIADTIRDNFRRSLREGTGCNFATTLTRGGRVAFKVHDETPTSEVDDALDAYAASNLIVVLLLPFVTSERVLVEVLAELARNSPRWRLKKGNHTAESVHLAGDRPARC
jgi:hypothetical protein